MTKPDIYKLHETAFASVSAYVILDKGERVATIAFKYPRDGSGRLYAYVHWHGIEMVRGYAGGYGYDKHSAACSSAAARMTDPTRMPKHMDVPRYDTFRAELRKDDGFYWDRRLRDAGFTVLQAV
jgi:hypothetical protein